jgi:hypothetical protein
VIVAKKRVPLHLECRTPQKCILQCLDLLRRAFLSGHEEKYGKEKDGGHVRPSNAPPGETLNSEVRGIVDYYTRQKGFDVFDQVSVYFVGGEVLCDISNVRIVPASLAIFDHTKKHLFVVIALIHLLEQSVFFSFSNVHQTAFARKKCIYSNRFLQFL